MRLVVTTWNLEGRAGVDVDAVAALLREQGSDVVLLQEVQSAQARRLARALSARTLDWQFKHRPPLARPEGMAVLGVTRPIDSTRARALTMRWRRWSWRRRIVQFASVGDLTLVHVHLSPHGDQGARARELGTILDHMADGGTAPFAVAGDFNALPGSDLVDELTAASLRDAWLVADGGRVGGGETNWSSPGRSGPPDQRLDYVWVSAGLEVRRAQLPSAGAGDGFEPLAALSDHLPLTVELERPRQVAQ